MLERLWRWTRTHTRLLVVLLTLVLLAWPAKIACDRLTASPQKWAAEMAAGDALLAVNDYEALDRYLEALHEIRKIGGNDIREARTLEQLAMLGNESRGPCDYIPRENIREYFGDLRYIEEYPSIIARMKSKSHVRYVERNILPFLTRAIAIRRREQGDLHPDLLKPYRILIEFYGYRRSSKMVTRYGKLALAIAKHSRITKGIERHETLGTICNAYKQCEDKKNLYLYAGELIRIAFDDPGPNGKYLYLSIKYLTYNHYVSNKMTNERITCWYKAVRYFELQSNHNNRYYSDALRELAQSYMENNQTTEAEKHLLKNILVLEYSSRNSHSSISDLTKIYTNTKQNSRIIFLYNRIMKIRKKLHGKYSLQVCDMHIKMSDYYENTGNYNQQEKSLMASRQLVEKATITKKNNSQYLSCYNSTLRRLSTLYNKQHRKAEEQKVRNEFFSMFGYYP